MRKARTKRQPTQPNIEPHIPPPPPPEVSERLRSVHQEALERMRELADEYGAEEVPERLQDRARAVLTAPSVAEGERLGKRVQDAMLVHVLAQWARNRIPGKMSELSVAKRVKRALSLADMLEARELHDQAASQRERAAKIQAEWDEYKTEKTREQREA